MEVRSFIIDGHAVGKERPRKGKYTIYTPKRTTQFEKHVRNCYLDKYGDKHLMIGPLAVKVVSYREIIKSMSKKDKKLAMDGDIFPTKRPDIDNVMKSIMDALNGVAYKDDKQVVDCYGYKRYCHYEGEEEYTEVTIYERE